MAHRGVRSEKGKLHQLLRKIIFKTSYHDPIMAETVCRVSHDELQYVAWNWLAQIDPTCEDNSEIEIPDVEKGLILSDSRGRGVFQQK